jgi:hypothetical protein
MLIKIISTILIFLILYIIFFDCDNFILKNNCVYEGFSEEASNDNIAKDENINIINDSSMISRIKNDLKLILTYANDLCVVNSDCLGIYKQIDEDYKNNQKAA